MQALVSNCWNSGGEFAARSPFPAARGGARMWSERQGVAL